MAVMTLPSDIISPAKNKKKKNITDIGLFTLPVGPLTSYWFILFWDYKSNVSKSHCWERCYIFVLYHGSVQHKISRMRTYFSFTKRLLNTFIAGYVLSTVLERLERFVDVSFLMLAYGRKKKPFFFGRTEFLLQYRQWPLGKLRAAEETLCPVLLLRLRKLHTNDY